VAKVGRIVNLEAGGKHVGAMAWCLVAGKDVKSAVAAERGVTMVGDARVKAARVVPPLTLDRPAVTPEHPESQTPG
jgi:hypothetical protein